VDVQSLFGGPLQPDPAVALRPPANLPRPKSGPLHKVQYVIELVGPHSVLASSAAALLSPQWVAALGEPQMYAMAPSDTEWRPLTTNATGSYDSIALTWDIVSPRGELTSAAAEHLQRAVEQFAPSIQRRVMPLPIPADIDKTKRQLVQLRDNLDVGFGMAVLPPAGIPERAVWTTCARLGMDIGPTGEFEWRVPGWNLPLLSVSPLGPADQFSLRAVQASAVHPALSLGFNVPTNPGPAETLEACFQVADALAASCAGTVIDENDRPLTEKSKNTYRENLKEAIHALTSVGFAPGSPEALRLFGG
jgi:hypothetical protein